MRERSTNPKKGHNCFASWMDTQSKNKKWPDQSMYSEARRRSTSGGGEAPPSAGGRVARLAGGQGRQICHNIQTTLLDKVLQMLKTGQTATIRGPAAIMLNDPLPETETAALAQVKLLHIYTSVDCSWGTHKILKEIHRNGCGSWCDTPGDESRVKLRIEEVWGLNITPTRHSDDDSEASPGDLWVPPSMVDAVVGNGQLCDALERAILTMKRKETAVVHCSAPELCYPGLPELDWRKCVGGVAFRVTLVDFAKVPETSQMSEYERRQYMIGRKAMGDVLLGRSRFLLASQRYEDALAICSSMDRNSKHDTANDSSEFPELPQRFKVTAYLNLSLCRLRLGDVAGVFRATNPVLGLEPDNPKAWFRQAQAHMLLDDYVSTSRTLEYLLELHPDLQEAKALLREVAARHRKEDDDLKTSMLLGRLFSGQADPRSAKFDYMSAPTSSLPSEPDAESDMSVYGRCGYDDV
eukprot:TRINITY_DN20388_c0_g1_i3.p1 TRINITY_DN20388_c0_g1~~TRINITY_DN20388_c0_g1_i3.p1  ORF type:complete len:467 (-),score=73.51 TRINITY_DN20388_c0_g1_i3:555-1955(-)